MGGRASLPGGPPIPPGGPPGMLGGGPPPRPAICAWKADATCTCQNQAGCSQGWAPGVESCELSWLCVGDSCLWWQCRR